MTNVHIHVPEAPFWDPDIYGNRMQSSVPVFSKLGRGPRGLRGEKGDSGEDGVRGEDGFSPWVYFDNSGETAVLVVVDRKGEHRWPLDVTAASPEAMAIEFSERSLWPKWFDYYADVASTPSYNANGSFVGWSKIENFSTVFHRTASQVTTLAADASANWSAANVVLAPISYRFIRNGLEYTYQSGQTVPDANKAVFSVSGDTLFFKPRLDAGHNIEEVQLSILVSPISVIMPT